MKTNRLGVKRFFAAVTAAAAALSTSSCSENVTHEHINTPKKISFSWWGNDTRSDYTLEAINEFTSEHSDIDVNPLFSDFVGYKENLDALFNIEKESDIMQINYAWLSEYSPDGEGFYDLNTLSEYIDLSNFTDEELSYGTKNGKLNAIPISLNSATFYYNQSLFDEYGLSIPKTWDDLFTCAEKFSADGIYTIETSEIYYWLMLVAHEEQISGKPVFSDDTSEEVFDESNVESMMTFYKQLIDGNVLPYGASYNRDDFFSGKIAGEILWVSDSSYYAEPLEESGGTVTIGDYLTTDDYKRSGWYVKPTCLYAISSNTKSPQQAAEFLDFLLNSEQMAALQGTEKGVPLSNSALETLSADEMLNGVAYEASKKISDSDVHLTLMPDRLETVSRYDEFFKQFDLYYYGQKTLEQAAEDFVGAYPF